MNEALDSILDVEFEVRRVDKKTMLDAINIAYKYNITIYDAYFIALSRVEGKPLITADYKLTERVNGLRGIIKLLDI